MSAAQALCLSSRVHNGRASLLSARRTRTARQMHAGAAQAASGKLTLYTNPRSRSQIVEWYAKELGISYEVQMLDMGALGFNPVAPRLIACGALCNASCRRAQGARLPEGAPLWAAACHHVRGRHRCLRVGRGNLVSRGQV